MGHYRRDKVEGFFVQIDHAENNHATSISTDLYNYHLCDDKHALVPYFLLKYLYDMIP